MSSITLDVPEEVAACWEALPPAERRLPMLQRLTAEGVDRFWAERIRRSDERLAAAGVNDEEIERVIREIADED